MEGPSSDRFKPPPVHSASGYSTASHSGCCGRLGKGRPPNQVACCQGAVLDDHAGSNGARFLSPPSAIITNVRTQAPLAGILGVPAAASRLKYPLRGG